jgi:ParB family transcriptional regulator, chromosome partitioning protein
MARRQPAADPIPPAEPAPSASPADPIRPFVRPCLWDALYLHPLNTRSEPPDAEIAALADSIATQGLLQNLMGFLDPARPHMIGIVAGGRRLRALTLLIERGDWAADRPIPVLLTADEDLAAAWAGTENEARQGLHPADEVRAYRDLRRRGQTPETIARTFAVTVSHVHRRLALATLPETALDALRAGTLSIETARILTLAKSEKQAKSALERLLSGNLSRWQLKDELTKNTVSAGNARVRYVGLDAYVQAGGTLTTDLFEDAQYLHDTALIDQLAQAKGDAEVKALREAGGWAWAQFLIDPNKFQHSDYDRIQGTEPELPEGDLDRLQELEETDPDDLTAEAQAELAALQARFAPTFTDEERATGGVIAHLNYRGEVVEAGVFRRKGDAPPDAGTATEDNTVETRRADPPEAAMPQNLKDDLTAIRLLSIQYALASQPQLLIDLLAWQASAGLSPYSPPFAIQITAPRNRPERPEGTQDVPSLVAPQPDYRADPTPDRFTAFQATGRDQIDRALTWALARAYARPTGTMADWLATQVQPDPRALWSPTAAGFLSRVSGSYLDRLWADLVPPSDLDPVHATFRGLPKKDKAKRLDALFNDMSTREALGLSREQNAAIDAWLPEELRFAAPASPPSDDADQGGA